MYYISDNKDILQLNRVLELLQQTYWANQRTQEVVEKSIKNSICFGVYLKESNLQVGFARVITDYATTYYLCDVIVDEKYRGHGIGKALIQYITQEQSLQGLPGMLVTQDAHGLYSKYGFGLVEGRFMWKRPE